MVSSERYSLQLVTTAQRDLWERYMQEQGGHYLQSWTWGELKARFGWSTLRFALVDSESKQFVAAAQVLQRTAMGLPTWVGHLAYIPKGPLLDWSQPDLCTLFFRKLDQELKKRNAFVLRMDLPQDQESPEAASVIQWMQELKSQPIRSVQPVRTISLDISQDEEAIRARMKPKWRYNVGLSARKGVTVRKATTEADIEAWHKILEVTSERDKFGVHTLPYYLDFWHLTRENKQAELFLAEHEGELLAGMFVTCYGGEGIYMYGASTNHKRELMPNHLLIWETMRWSKEHGAKKFDLWGIPDTEDENEHMAGVYFFKKGWGGQVIQFVSGYERIYNPLAMKFVRKFL